MALLTWQDTAARETPKGLGEKLASLLRGSRGGEARALRHLETLSLGPRRTLYLVECDGERFLVAAGADSLSAPVPLTHRSATRGAHGVEER